MNFGNISKKKLLLLGSLFAILLVIPLTIYLLQQQQNTQTKADKTTTLSFSPNTATATVGGQISMDVVVTPGNNQVNFIKLVIDYDSTKLEATSDSFVVNSSSNFQVFQNAEVSADSLSVSLAPGADPTKVIQTPTKIGTITFQVIGSSPGPTQVSFDPTETDIRSLGQTSPDGFEENVFLSGAPATITIQGEGGTDTNTDTNTDTDTDQQATESADLEEETDTGSTSATQNQPPVCQDLVTDLSLTGPAPYTLTFTANGTDSDGTIEKVSFNFGEGSVEDVTSTGGIGTNTVSVQSSHTYQTPDTYTASAIMTDNNGAVSGSNDCNVTVTVTGDITPVPSGVTPIADVGPNETILGVGILGGLIFIIGAIALFAL